MLYARVVLGIPVEGPFDYIVPLRLAKKIKAGARVWVTFRTKRMLGYVVELTKKTAIRKLKTILEVIDDYPILDKNILSLTKQLSDYYSCSWGEAIETALPEALRRGRTIADLRVTKHVKEKDNPKISLIHSIDNESRWNIYLKYIKETLDNHQSTIVLLPDIGSVLKAKETIFAGLGIEPVLLYRKQPKELGEWLKIREGKPSIVIGSRSGIFAPAHNLGLIIIDEEQDAVYKQDQVPHYHARVVGLMRSNIEKAKLILGSTSPSLESFYLAKKNKIEYTFIPKRQDFPEIKIIDTKSLPFIKSDLIFAKYLKDCIVSTLNSSGKVLLFLNRSGFATFASCRHCGVVLKCPRCNINLVFHFKSNLLKCHYCNFKITPPQICPDCNSGYIRFSGVGTEKIESEISRIFPQARVQRLETRGHIDINDADIFIATKSVIKERDYNFDLTGVLAIDNSLNRIDFRASEKTFALLAGLLGLTTKKIVIQTRLPHHHVFSSLINKDMDIFYNEELRQRKQINFPPYRHISLVKLRAKVLEKVKFASHKLFDLLDEHNKDKDIKIVSVNPGQPAKLRGNFYWQILITTPSVKKVTRFLKMHLKNFSHSGIIVTVDIDPA